MFSKKVEYLHNLVYQALETIIHKRSQAKQAAGGAGGPGDKVSLVGQVAVFRRGVEVHAKAAQASKAQQQEQGQEQGRWGDMPGWVGGWVWGEGRGGGA